MPILSDTFFSFGEAEATNFLALDLSSRFHQIRVPEGNQQHTQFTSWIGNFPFKRLPFGLIDSPATS